MNIDDFGMDIETTDALKEQLRTSRSIRKALAYESHFWFFYIYLSHHVLYPPADFHKEMFDLTQDTSAGLTAITAFRGSGKSTIMSLSFPIWAIIGKPGIKYILIISHVQQQATQILANIKSELETNSLLIEDFGRHMDTADTWNSSTIVLSEHNARITALSTGSSIRGLKQSQFRPQLIICDDIESLESVKTMESRQGTFNWFTLDVLPCGDINTHTFVIGNLLHEDSLLSRLKEQIHNNPKQGIYREYPLLQDDKCLWPAKFKTEEDIEKLKNSVFDDVAWNREYLLRIISDASRVIYPEWIKTYETTPSVTDYSYEMTTVGVDPAISEKATADYTAIVTARLYESDGKPRIYILPNMVNKRLNFADASSAIQNVVNSLEEKASTQIYVENVGYQDALSQYLKGYGYSVEAVRPTGDKRTRLSALAPLIADGTIVFPKQGCEAMISQITNFGVEKHDDIADALVYAVMPLLEYTHRPRVRVWDEKPEGF